MPAPEAPGKSPKLIPSALRCLHQVQFDSATLTTLGPPRFMTRAQRVMTRAQWVMTRDPWVMTRGRRVMTHRRRVMAQSPGGQFC